MSIRVEVTAEDIARGDHRCGTCPVALAMARVGFRNPIVGPQHVSYAGRDNGPVALPPVARAFVAVFDARLAVEPFSFDLEVAP